MAEVDIDEFNRQQSIRWMHLPHAATIDLVDELCRRDDVCSIKVESGKFFQFHGPGRVIFVKERRER